MVEQEYSPERKCQKCGARFWSKLPQVRCFNCRLTELTDVIEEIKRLVIEGIKAEFK